MPNPEDIFEVSGYYEDLVIRSASGSLFLGSRTMPKPEGRLLGWDGAVNHTLTEPVQLRRGHKAVMVKASARKPIKCVGVAQALCGRKLNG